MSRFILRMVCVYTKTRVSRTKVVYESGKAEYGTILKSGDISNESQVCDNNRIIT